ncbi:MAG: hypothetical protein ACLTBV_18560 [Enterocloster bolteae]
MNEVMQWYERDMTLAQAMDGIETNMWASVRNYIAVGWFYLERHPRQKTLPGGWISEF